MTIKKLTTAIAVAGFITTVMAPAAFAETTIDITKNGADSTNTVNVNTGGSGDGTSVHQTNNTTAVTQIAASSNTGDNSANKNTGGDVSIQTGQATTTVAVVVQGGTNVANTTGECDTCGEPVNVTIDRNGAGSTNTVNVGSEEEGDNPWDCGILSFVFGGGNDSSKKVKQKNNTTAVTGVMAGSNTGGNKAKKNTNGTTSVRTRAATTAVSVLVGGSSNTLNP